MDNTTTYVTLGLGLLFAWSFFSYIYPALKEIVRIHLTSTASISMLPLEGQVEVVGITENEITHSLLTQKACVLWQIVVQELRVSYGHSDWYLTDLIPALKSPDWVTTHIETSPEPFDINDSTGKIRILPSNVYLVLRGNRESSSLFPLDLQIKDVLERLGVETTDYLGNDKSLRVYEHIIEPAEEIYIVGEIKYENGVKAITAAENAQQIISDHSQRELLSKLYRDVAWRIFLLTLTIFSFWGLLNSK